MEIVSQVTIPAATVQRTRCERVFVRSPGNGDGRIVAMDASAGVFENSSNEVHNCRKFVSRFSHEGDCGQSDLAAWTCARGWRAEASLRCAATDDSFIMTEWLETTARFHKLVGEPFCSATDGNVSLLAMRAHDELLEDSDFSDGDGFEFVAVERHGEEVWLTLCGSFHVIDAVERSLLIAPHSVAYNPSERQRVVAVDPSCLSYPHHEYLLDSHMAATRAIGMKWFETVVPKPAPLVLPEPETVRLQRGRVYVIVNRTLRSRFRTAGECVDFATNPNPDPFPEAGPRGAMGFAVVRA
jgi:hypothetical protein